MKQASAFLAFDMICMEIFGYSLNAVLSDPESTEKSKGAELFQAIQSLLAAQAAGGLYADPTAKQVKPEEVVAARDIWKGFIGDLVAHLRSSPSSPYSQALLSMEKGITSIDLPFLLHLLCSLVCTVSNLYHYLIII